MLSRRD